jgi:hypothetical protein
VSSPPPEPPWQEGAGSLLLLAAAHETGLLEALERAMPVGRAAPTSRLAHSTSASRRRLVLTLLFLEAVGLRRIWDLRGYTGAGLALLSRRSRSPARWLRRVSTLLCLSSQDTPSPSPLPSFGIGAIKVPLPPAEEDRPAYRYPPSDAQGRAWWMEGWQPTPSPSTPTEPKLIPIVTTAPDTDLVALAHLYRQRWSVQENILKDWLLPLGLDTNHGFVKTPVENLEVAKCREALERRLANIQHWATKAHERAQRASKLAERLRQETKAHGDILYLRINGYICEHDCGNEREWRLQHKLVVKAMQAEADADLDERWRRYERVWDRQEQEATKRTRSCLEQCDLLRALAELEAKERAMYELENSKDQKQ